MGYVGKGRFFGTRRWSHFEASSSNLIDGPCRSDTNRALFPNEVVIFPPEKVNRRGTVMTTDENPETVKVRFSIRDLLVLTALVALYFAWLRLMLEFTNGDWEVSLWVTIPSFIYVLWRCAGARCSNCGRWWRKRSTGAYKSGRGASSAHLEEFECKSCGKSEWNSRTRSFGGGGG